MHSTPLVWQVGEQQFDSIWLTENAVRPPAHVTPIDDTMRADEAYRLACEGHALLWQGDYHNARQLLSALARRCESGRPAKRPAAAASPVELFHRHRLQQSRRARILSMLLVPLEANYCVALRRAPDVRDACEAAWGEQPEAGWLSLQALQGALGAFEWQRRGIRIAGLEQPLHPRYGVFSPIRGEYLQLVLDAPLPAGTAGIAFDIGTGSGVLALLLAQRGFQRIIATDINPSAISCAQDNIDRQKRSEQISVVSTDLFPDGAADLIVCNPPWLPARPTSTLEQAIYDPDNQMLKAFLAGAAAHLRDGGEVWLILSDLAEHLELRSRAELLTWIADAGLEIAGALHTRPQHGKSQAGNDLLAQARQREITSLWRLKKHTAAATT